MKDIESKADLEHLMADFYNRLLRDPAISYIFTDIAKIDLPSHLPKIVNFWDQVIFNAGNYRTNVMQVHLNLHAQEPFTEKHFETWLGHLHNAVDENFKGENAEKLKTRALSIATMMKLKTTYSS